MGGIPSAPARRQRFPRPHVPPSAAHKRAMPADKLGVPGEVPATSAAPLARVPVTATADGSIA